MDLIILAGGMGTRLQGVIGDLPKCLATVAGKPFIEHLLDYLKPWEFEKIILSVGYQKEMIISHFEANVNDKLLFAIEDSPLGTGGAIKYASGFSRSETLLVINGDTLFRIDLDRMINLFALTSADIAIALRKTDDTSRYGNVIIDSNSRITGFMEKSSDSGSGLINGGIYLMNRRIIEQTPFTGSFSFERDFLPHALSTHKVIGIEFNDYFIDIGIPLDLEQAQSDFK